MISRESGPGEFVPVASRHRGAPPCSDAPSGAGYVLVLTGATLFGINASVSKVVLAAGIEPARLTALRCTGAALGLLFVLKVLRPTKLRMPRREWPIVVLGLSGAAFLSGSTSWRSTAFRWALRCSWSSPPR